MAKRQKIQHKEKSGRYSVKANRPSPAKRSQKKTAQIKIDSSDSNDSVSVSNVLPEKSSSQHFDDGSLHLTPSEEFPVRTAQVFSKELPVDAPPRPALSSSSLWHKQSANNLADMRPEEDSLVYSIPATQDLLAQGKLVCGEEHVPLSPPLSPTREGDEENGSVFSETERLEVDGRVLVNTMLANDRLIRVLHEESSSSRSAPLSQKEEESANPLPPRSRGHILKASIQLLRSSFLSSAKVSPAGSLSSKQLAAGVPLADARDQNRSLTDFNDCEDLEQPIATLGPSRGPSRDPSLSLPKERGPSLKAPSVDRTDSAAERNGQQRIVLTRVSHSLEGNLPHFRSPSQNHGTLNFSYIFDRIANSNSLDELDIDQEMMNENEYLKMISDKFTAKKVVIDKYVRSGYQGHGPRRISPAPVIRSSGSGGQFLPFLRGSRDDNDANSQAIADKVHEFDEKNQNFLKKSPEMYDRYSHTLKNDVLLENDGPSETDSNH